MTTTLRKFGAADEFGKMEVDEAEAGCDAGSVFRLMFTAFSDSVHPDVESGQQLLVVEVSWVGRGRRDSDSHMFCHAH